jgi:hypothetical protein
MAGPSGGVKVDNFNERLCHTPTTGTEFLNIFGLEQGIMPGNIGIRVPHGRVGIIRSCIWWRPYKIVNIWLTMKQVYLEFRFSDFKMEESLGAERDA